MSGDFSKETTEIVKYQIFKEEKIAYRKQEGIFPNSFQEVDITLITKLDKDITVKEKQLHTYEYSS